MNNKIIRAFSISVDAPEKAKVKPVLGITFHQIFWKIKLSKTVRKNFFLLCELIDRETGILSQEFSDGKRNPLSKKQLSVHFGDSSIASSLDELVSNGIFAEILVARTSFYIANPYIVCYGFECNAYLLNIFNKITLSRYDRFNKLLANNQENEAGKLWGVMDVK